MDLKESGYSQDWFRIGEKELKRAKNLFDLKDFEGAGFNIQQAVEKYLKGFLLSKGWKLRRIHDLEKILNDAVLYEPSLEKFRETCQKITEFYIEERYPLFESSELTENDIRNALESANELINMIIEITKKK